MRGLVKGDWCTYAFWGGQLFRKEDRWVPVREPVDIMRSKQVNALPRELT